MVELLIVIAIIVILFAVILVAVDPPKRLGQARDAVRRQDVRDILEAVQQYMVDNDGAYPTGLDDVQTSYQVLGTGVGCDTTCGAATTLPACLDMSGDLVEEYLADIPFDPSTGSAANTDYAIELTAGDRIEVLACDPEIAATISAKR